LIECISRKNLADIASPIIFLLTSLDNVGSVAEGVK